MNEELPEKRQEEISDYLHDDLSPAAREGFELRMKQDADLKAEVTLANELLQALNEQDWHSGAVNPKSKAVIRLRDQLRSPESIQLSDTIKTVGTAYITQTKVPKTTTKKWYYSACAAVVVLLIAAAYIFKTPALEDHYENYANWDDLPSITEKNNQTSALHAAEKFYRNKAYFKAIEKIQEIHQNNSTLKPNAMLYLGASYVKVGEYKKALHTFNELAQGNTIDQSKGYWYALLTYLKLGDRDNAVKTIEIITQDPTNYNYKQALELQQEIK